jgi:hypothetical protein
MLLQLGTSTIPYTSRQRDERNWDTTFRDETFRDGLAIVCNFLLLFHVLTTVGINYCNIISYLEAPKNVIKGFYAGSLNLIFCTCHSTKLTSLQAQKQILFLRYFKMMNEDMSLTDPSLVVFPWTILSKRRIIHVSKHPCTFYPLKRSACSPLFNGIF